MDTLKAGSTFRKQFVLRDAAGNKSDPDVAASAVFVRNGADDTVNIIQPLIVKTSTGVHFVTGTVPATYNAGDDVQVRVEAAVASYQFSFYPVSFRVVLHTQDEIFATAAAGGIAGGFHELLLLSLTENFPAGSLGFLFSSLLLSLGNFRTVQVVDGTYAQVRAVTIQPLPGGTALPLSGMVRNPALRVAVTTGPQAGQKSQISAWIPGANGTVVVTIGQAWPGPLDVGDVLTIY